MAERKIRFGVASIDRDWRAATWRCWSNLGKDNSVYLTCRELKGSLHLSLHETGRWHMAFERNGFDQLFEEPSRQDSRFVGQWLKPQETAPGLVLACRIHIPWYNVTFSNSKESKDIFWIAAPEQGQMCEVCIFLASPGMVCTDWPGAKSMKTALVGSFELADDSRVWIVSRNTSLIEPVLPSYAKPSFLKGNNEESLNSDTLRAVIWGNADDGSVGLFESPVRMQRNHS